MVPTRRWLAQLCGTSMSSPSSPSRSVQDVTRDVRVLHDYSPKIPPPLHEDQNESSTGTQQSAGTASSGLPNGSSRWVVNYALTVAHLVAADGDRNIAGEFLDAINPIRCGGTAKERKIMNTATTQTYSQTPTNIINTAGVDFAYRRRGSGGDLPLVLAGYFTSNMDDWDPLIVDGLAADREVITFDYPGVGSSTGVTPANVAELSGSCLDFLHGLGLTRVDFLGFSLGGMIAQQMAFEEPGMIRRMVLCGTGPRGGEKMTFTELSADEQDDPVALILKSFFTPSKTSQSAGDAYLRRLRLHTAQRDSPVTRTSADAQLRAIRAWGTIPTNDRYAMLNGISQPTLIVHGNKDIVVDPINAFILQQHLPHATLLLLPDASHGAQSQHAEVFLANARLFLNN